MRRREVLIGAAALAGVTGAGATGAGPAAMAAEGPDLSGWIVVDALGGLSDPNPAGKDAKDPYSPRVLAEAKASGITAVNLTIGYVAGPEDPYRSTLDDIATNDALIAAHPRALLKVFSVADIETARRTGRVGVFYGVQNTAMLQKKPERVAEFVGKGLRVIQLTYNPANDAGDGSMAPLNRGLTDFGRDVVARCNAARAMVDLSHSGQATCLEAARVSTAPISINHTGCRALCDLPRNKTDEELRLVAGRGGFVGIYFMPYLTLSGHPTAADVVAHLEHAVNVCGEDHVGIGTDGSVTGIDDLEAYRSALAQEIAHRKALGMSATGERADTYPFVADLRGPTQFRKLAGLLAARGWRTARIEKVMGANFMAYAREIWGA